MDRDEQVECVRLILDRLTTDQSAQWKRIRSELQWWMFWPMAKAVFLLLIGLFALLGLYNIGA